MGTVNWKNVAKVYQWANIDQFCPCLLCGLAGGDGTGLCSDCQQDLPWLAGSLCRCGLPRRRASPACPGCLCEQWPLQAIRPCFRYAFPVDRLLNRYKHHRDLACERVLGQLWRRHPPDAGAAVALVPVPLHWRRQLWRGFNQAHHLAADLSRGSGLPVRPLLRSGRSAPAQQTLGRTDRLEGAGGRFECHTALHGENLVLVDDVVTTGATVAACSQALLAAGAGSVTVWCLARTLPE